MELSRFCLAHVQWCAKLRTGSRVELCACAVAARARLARLSGGDSAASCRDLLFLLRPPREVRRCSKPPVPEWSESLAAEMPSEAVDWFVVVGSLPSSLVPTPVTRRLSSAPDGKVVGPAIRGLFNGWLVQPVCTTRHSTLRVVCAVKRRLLPRG